jgi:tetratricopeptide (TPR) repeat protein
MEERWPEAMAAAEQVINLYPNDVYGYDHLANEKLATGAADEAIPLFEKAIRLDPRSGYLFNRLRRIGYCLLVLGQEQEAISWLQRLLVAKPDAPVFLLAVNYRELAAAYALIGHSESAHEALSQAAHLWPFATVRSEIAQDASSGDLAARQLRHFQEGLRLAGLRDHAEENADFGVASDGNLRRGARTIRTVDPVPFLAGTRPIVVDTVSHFRGRSIPGAVGLKLSGLRGNVHDSIQDRLHRKMQALTNGGMSSPIVAVGWNSESFDGRNLALRLVAIGYTHVYWYRD